LLICDFIQHVRMLSLEKSSFVECAKMFSHKKRDDKYFQEESLPIYAYVVENNIDPNLEIVRGREKYSWDARIGNDIILEVVQALPPKAYMVRKGLSKGLCSTEIWYHIQDEIYFPDVIVKSIQLKQKKIYPEKRILLVSVLGEYTYESDDRIFQWVSQIRRTTDRGQFAGIYLVDVSRLKIYSIF